MNLALIKLACQISLPEVAQVGALLTPCMAVR